MENKPATIPGSQLSKKALWRIILLVAFTHIGSQTGLMKASAASPHLPGSAYTVTALDFVPTAINDKRLIVGSRDGKPVRYSDGQTKALPYIADPQHPYRPVDVNNAGVILAATDRNDVPAVYWNPPGYGISGLLEAPLIGVFLPLRISDNGVVAGNGADAEQPYRWTRQGGYELLRSPSDQYVRLELTDMNDVGTAVGFIEDKHIHRSLLIWPAHTAKAQMMPVTIQSKPLIGKDGTIVSVVASNTLRTWAPSGHFTDRILDNAVGYITITGYSSAGRMVGIATKNEVSRGWTILGDGPIVWLTAPGLQDGDYLVPVGVNRCGDIISILHRGSSSESGVLHARRLNCDLQGVPVIH